MTTNLSDTIGFINALQTRARKIAPLSFVQVLCSCSGWSGYINDLRISIHNLPDSCAALAALDAALAKIEDRDGTLARTLGIAA